MAYTNIEDQRRNKREYYLKNKEIIKGRAILWNQDNPEQVRETRIQRRIKEKLKEGGE